MATSSGLCHAIPEAMFYKASGDGYESISVAKSLIFLTFGAKLD
jgi:hypothetical protein